MILTSFFPNHARAFIVSPPSRTLKCGVTSAGASPNFYIPSCVQEGATGDRTSGIWDVQIEKRSRVFAWWGK